MLIFLVIFHYAWQFPQTPSNVTGTRGWSIYQKFAFASLTKKLFFHFHLLGA
ncbi:hypothetical protein KC19_3G237200 [Ceratodon purpureus]|uniref:Uncharacterized protein n=1 Tax=Ceratodon purpureus TaxID=3225 RepID=A0A8T0IR19_CERPU|nr:hypothetical protein KC19_3G237200 [Ceratodon purpureus]